MLKIEQVKSFLGFGTGKVGGEYYYSQGMNKSLFGLVPGWLVRLGQSQSSLPTLDLINFFSQGLLNGVNYVAAVDALGQIYRSSGGLTAYSLFYKPGDATSGNGLIFDQNNRLLFASKQYLGLIDPVTTADYAAGTVSVTNGSAAVVGTGTTFAAGDVGKMFRVTGTNLFYKILTFTDATHITLASNYTGTTNATASYTIFRSTTDRWKDFGFATDNFRSMDTYEDWVIACNNQYLAVLNITDDSFNAQAFSLPSGFVTRCVRAGRTGILVGANLNNRGIVFLWDAQTPRSISPWIWFNANVKCIVPIQNTGTWIVITSRGIYYTDGYTLQTIKDGMPDDSAGAASVLAAVQPQAAEILGKYLVFWGTQYGYFNRLKDGVYVLNLETQTLEFAPVSNGCLRGVAGGAIFFDNNFRTHLSWTTANPASKNIGTLENTRPTSAQLITEMLGVGTENAKAAQGFKLSLGLSARAIENAGALTFDVTAKIYNFRRKLWDYAITNLLSPANNLIRVDGTLFEAETGDEITIMEGVNAGQIRHIASIANRNTNTETWTLDSALPNATETDIYLNISPFQKISKKTLTNLTELRDLYFDIRNKVDGKRYLVKLLFENLNTVTPEIYSGYFIYDDSGVL